MFSSYPRDTATYQSQATLPPLQQTTYPTYIHEAPIQQTRMEVSVFCNRLVVSAQGNFQEAVQDYYFRRCLAGLEQDHLVSLDQLT